MDLSEKVQIDWNFKDCNKLVQGPNNKYVYMCVLYLKIQFSFPENIDFNGDETVRHLELLNNPVFGDFKVCVDYKTFYVS